MNPSLIAPEVIQRLAGSLLHFIWQGAVIAMFACAGLRMLRHRSAEARYALAIGSLVCMLAAPLFTVAFYSQTGAVARQLILALSPASIEARSATTALQASQWAQRILLAWLIGVVVLATRLVVGWRLAWQLVKSAEAILTPEVLEIFESVRERLGLRAPIRLLSHGRLDSPVVVGWLRPFVLLPVSVISGFTTEQLRAILAHELAHIRRHDFVVNILQRAVESILFYHPAVWWLSKRIRAEREHCCDDIAIRLCGSRRIYAEVLIEMERARQPRPILSVAAADGAVLQRFRRVLGMSASIVDWQSAVGTLLFLGVWVVIGICQSASAVQAAPAVFVKPVTATEAIVLPVTAPTAVVESVHGIAAILTAQPVAQVPAGAQAQVGQAGPVFEVSLVSSDATGLGGQRLRISTSRTPQRLAFQNALLADVMAFAYGMPVERIQGRPQWMYNDLFDIAVTTAVPASVEEQRLTLQKLIVERFGLVFHRDTYPSPFYFLVAGANVKLTKSGADEEEELPQFARRAGVAPRGAFAAGTFGPGITIEGRHVSMGDLALWLYSTIQLPVVDKTGITGYFDVQIPGFPGRPSEEGVTLAVRNALGLNLELQHGTAESLIIDRAEPPKVN